jgi:hypothetical protein
MSGSFFAFIFFLLDLASFEMAAFLSGEACGTSGDFFLLFSLGVGVGVGIGVGVDVERGSVEGFIAIAISGDMAADDDDEGNSGNSGRRSLPLFRDGDLNVDALAASCSARICSSVVMQSAAACTTNRGGMAPSPCARAAADRSFFAERLAINIERLRFAAFAAWRSATAAA